MKISILPRHIKEGKPNSRANNPLVYAIKSTVGYRFSVSIQGVRAYVDGRPYMISAEGLLWLQNFNENKEVKPLKLTLEKL